jgi:hypothetical protein
MVSMEKYARLLELAKQVDGINGEQVDRAAVDAPPWPGRCAPGRGKFRRSSGIQPKVVNSVKSCGRFG